jgi:hypothetical protein
MGVGFNIVILSSSRCSPRRRVGSPPESEWIALTDGTSMDRGPAWSPNETRCTSPRIDGFLALGGSAKPSHKAAGWPAFGVYHVHNTRRGLHNTPSPPFALSAVSRLIFANAELTGNMVLMRQ